MAGDNRAQWTPWQCRRHVDGPFRRPRSIFSGEMARFGMSSETHVREALIATRQIDDLQPHLLGASSPRRWVADEAVAKREPAFLPRSFHRFGWTLARF